MSEYTVYYEVGVIATKEIIKETMIVEATDAARAEEYAAHVLEDRYDEDSIVLLACQVQ